MDTNRFKNYGLWLSIAAFIPLLLSSFGIQVLSNYQEIVNAFLGILVVAGIINNPTTLDRWFKDDTLAPDSIQETPVEAPTNATQSTTK